MSLSPENMCVKCMHYACINICLIIICRYMYIYFCWYPTFTLSSFTCTYSTYIFGGNVGENFWTTPSTEPCTPGLRGRLYVEPRVRAKRPHVGARIQGHPTLSPVRNTQKFDNKKHWKNRLLAEKPGRSCSVHEFPSLLSLSLCNAFRAPGSSALE